MRCLLTFEVFFSPQIRLSDNGPRLLKRYSHHTVLQNGPIADILVLKRKRRDYHDNPMRFMLQINYDQVNVEGLKEKTRLP